MTMTENTRTPTRPSGRRSTGHGRHRARTAPQWSVTARPQDKTFAEMVVLALCFNGVQCFWMVAGIMIVGAAASH